MIELQWYCKWHCAELIIDDIVGLESASWTVWWVVTARNWIEGRAAMTQKCQRTLPNRSKIYTLLVLFQIILTGTKIEAQEDGPGAGRVLLAKAKLKCEKEHLFSLIAKYKFLSGFNLCYKTFSLFLSWSSWYPSFVDVSKKTPPKIHLYLWLFFAGLCRRQSLCFKLLSDESAKTISLRYQEYY